MSRGLGETQRRLLVALYCAFDYDGEWDAHVIAGRGFEFDWCPLAQLRLVEVEHADRIGHTAIMRTTAQDRDFKRSRRAPYRRALRTLAARGLAEEWLRPVDLGDLQRGTLWHGQTATRPVLFARLTEDGYDWVIENSMDEVSALGKQLSNASFAHEPYAREGTIGFLERRPGEQAKRRKARKRAAQARSNEVDRDVLRPEALSKKEVVDLLVDEGHALDQVLDVLRRWHRDLRRNLRQQYGDAGPGLDEYSFDTAEIEEIRGLFHPPT